MIRIWNLLCQLQCGRSSSLEVCSGKLWALQTKSDRRYFGEKRNRTVAPAAAVFMMRATMRPEITNIKGQSIHIPARRTVQAQDFGENEDEDLIYVNEQLGLK
jgi:hypothetical protein